MQNKKINHLDGFYYKENRVALKQYFCLSLS